ncbi:MAG: alcohol dehydrogenase catalytic domain-containing protein [Desulfovibrio sp.]|nr:alcohol dehydrogenase catalytic domain-containing protein [Desulfovibrio sp.]
MQETMKAAVLVGPEHIEVREVAVPALAPGMILIRVSACGVCGSDVHMWRAGAGWSDTPIPDFRMGHEFCGVVVDPGDSHFAKGDRVTFWANMYCGVCDMCRQGREHLCRAVAGKNYIGFVCNGAYAEYFAGPARYAYKLPDTVSDVAAALIDPLMVAYHAVRHSSLRLHDRVLVVGSGIIAQLMGHLVKKAGASFLAMSKVNDDQLAKARELGDFDRYFDGAAPDRQARFREASKGGFDVVFEAVGSEASLAACLDAVRPGGEIVAVGNSVTPTIPFSLNSLVLNEVRLSGSVSCTRREFEETIDLIASGFIDPERFVTDIIGLDGLQEAMEKQSRGCPGLLKSVVRP